MTTSANQTPIQKSITQRMGEQPVTVEFSSENSKAIRDLVAFGRFGTSSEEVVITALSILYNIYTERSDAKTLIAQGPSGRTVLDLP